MSGTSADGITAALVRFDGRKLKVLRFRTYPYSSALRKRVLGATKLKAGELSRLNFELGEAFAQAALKISKGTRPFVIGSHGQTIWHGPDEVPANTLQLGEPSVIAERTGVAVVADFRPRDMAAGGQGAPLVPAFDEFLFGSGPARAILNIGGIANVSIIHGGKIKTAFDTGPGNGLMDLAVRLATKGRRHMDENGALAARGWADLKKVERMLEHPYFSRKAPKSLERTFFGEAFLKKNFGRVTTQRLPDVLATLALFTARSIAHSIKEPVKEVVVSGGGALNPVLMRQLANAVKPARVVTTAAYGLPVMAKEAACFAWLGWRAIEGRTNNSPRATGSQGPRILGKIVPA
jgi:anhydro-N-acetylmuramic acid kinase